MSVSADGYPFVFVSTARNKNMSIYFGGNGTVSFERGVDKAYVHEDTMRSLFLFLRGNYQFQYKRSLNDTGSLVWFLSEKSRRHMLNVGHDWALALTKADVHDLASVISRWLSEQEAKPIDTPPVSPPQDEVSRRQAIEQHAAQPSSQPPSPVSPDRDLTVWPDSYMKI